MIIAQTASIQCQQKTHYVAFAASNTKERTMNKRQTFGTKPEGLPQEGLQSPATGVERRQCHGDDDRTDVQLAPFTGTETT
ncbi:hypothetical protein EDC54_102393 [Samsonia erythrinae]|uniref:Uncharacterized protein n=1 Tax=Samsonia erythrinae TaxID=160434 RepID=A0A4R3VS35_9GAMM|nr:hypothetical protein EDC54_102393 [Samsonia erythrinae]